MFKVVVTIEVIDSHGKTQWSYKETVKEQATEDVVLFNFGGAVACAKELFNNIKAYLKPARWRIAVYEKTVLPWDKEGKAK